ncbi:MAG: hypothetical protein UR53_C0001G0122 [Candidatus Magasanikbacteria bacterium GW2011_GWC2_34_16]|uniref:Antitoxin n=2 Tax=Candidatus Magasanikiibacteriota TaxID=1752731 RepID=A0A0G0H8B0_9BACT|nr:MAG: hypothetical protein UR53_C0001G0122 [Candidatus Magasanikbacteria bacterium GW2011_GWC2_34_16]KKQ39508.1 MAG: hypothetical protein US58_C0031G0009 [Candidatus Magasanikbacteria bacterium GW2011_GWA2_37_8]
MEVNANFMRQNQLDKLMNLLKRTGDRLAVLDKDNDNVLMMMSIEEYERLLSGNEAWEELDEGEMLDKVERDIARWREHHDWEDDDYDEEDNSETPTTLDENFNPITDEETEPEEIEENIKPNQETETEKFGTVESLADVPQEEEEEKFYIEPIE